MKRIPTINLVLVLVMLMAGITAMSAGTFADESFNYHVTYKWGLVQKKAGEVNIRLTNRGDEYHARLTAKSDPWADRIFKVRDTLSARMTRVPFVPLHYEKIANEGGERKHDVVKYSYNGNTVTAACNRHVVKDGRVTKDENRTLQAEGMTVDMLSVFYYVRNLPFDTYDKDHITKINIFSGKRKELLTIKYIGIESIDCNKKVYQCYHATFKFTSDSGKKSSDDIDVWITTDSRRIPVKLEGKLPVGKVRCIYIGN